MVVMEDGGEMYALGVGRGRRVVGAVEMDSVMVLMDIT